MKNGGYDHQVEILKAEVTKLEKEKEVLEKRGESLDKVLKDLKR